MCLCSREKESLLCEVSSLKMKGEAEERRHAEEMATLQVRRGREGERERDGGEREREIKFERGERE